MPKAQESRNISAGSRGRIQPEVQYDEPLRPQTHPPNAPETAAQFHPAGEPHSGDTRLVMPQNCQPEAGKPAQERILHSRYAHRQWSTPDSEESIMDSLLALSAQLEFHEQRRRAS